MSAPASGDSSSLSAQRPVGWQVRHSAWLLALIFGCGVFSCVGFIYCAARVRARQWTIVATVATIASILAVALDAIWHNSAGEPSNAATCFSVMLWLVSIIFGFVVNRDYLEWRARR